MNFLIYFLITFTLFFIVLPLICFSVHIRSKRLELLCRPTRCLSNRSHWLRAWQCTSSATTESCENRCNNDRQANTCPPANGTRRDNDYNDIFFIEPNSQEAARIRAQLEKDDKDLPSYDEVMRIANLSSPTAAPVANSSIPDMPSALTMGASSSSVNTNDTILSVPSFRAAESHIVRPLTPPPYTPEPIGATVVVPITTPLHSQQNTQST